MRQINTTSTLSANAAAKERLMNRVKPKVADELSPNEAAKQRLTNRVKPKTLHYTAQPKADDPLWTLAQETVAAKNTYSKPDGTSYLRGSENRAARAARAQAAYDALPDNLKGNDLFPEYNDIQSQLAAVRSVADIEKDIRETQSAINKYYGAAPANLTDKLSKLQDEYDSVTDIKRQNLPLRARELGESIGAGLDLAWGGLLNAAGTVDEAISNLPASISKKMEAQRSDVMDDIRKVQSELNRTEDKAAAAMLRARLYELQQQYDDMLLDESDSEYYRSSLKDDAGDFIIRAEETADRVAQGRGTVSQKLMETAQSAAQMMGSAYVGGLTGIPAASNVTFGASAGGLNAYDAEKNGATNKEALAYGLLTGATEIVTEKLFGGNPLLDTDSGLANKAIGKITTDPRILSLISSKPVDVMNEGLEEMISEILQPVAARLTYDPNADWATIDDIIEAGIGGVLLSGVMNASGAVTGGINRGANAISDYVGDVRRGKMLNQADAYGAQTGLIESGLESDVGTRSREYAGEMQSRLQNGKMMTNAQTGRMQRFNAEDIAAEQAIDTRQELVDAGVNEKNADSIASAVDAVINGEEITGGAAEKIARSEPALDIIAQRTGVRINTDAPISTVKTAIRTLARNNSDAEVSTRSAAQIEADKQRVESVSKSFGDNGKAVISEFYDPNSQNAVDYLREMNSVYSAAIRGKKLDSVAATPLLNPAQRQAIYTAGESDAAASLRTELRNVENTAVTDGSVGLVYDEYVTEASKGNGTASLTVSDIERIDTVAKALGVRVQFADSVDGGQANAQISGNTVLIEKENQNPVMFLLGHEWTHRMQQLAPEEYRKFRESVSEEIEGEVEELLTLYHSKGKNISYEGAVDEAAANYAGRMIEDGKVLDDFIEKHRKDRTLLEKVRDAIRTLINKLTGAEKRMAQTAEGKLTAALEAAAKQVSVLQDGSSVVGTEGGYAKVNGKFSLKGVVEDNGELLALHNLTEKNLLDALELGGLPMPSIAVVRAETGHTKYGDISLVFDNSSIDPQADWRNKVYGGDAWTPTAPKIEYEPTKQAEDRLRDKYYDLARRIGYDKARPLYNYATDLEEELNRNGGEQAIIEKHLDDTSMMNLYLADTGRDMVEDIYKEIVHRIDDATREQYDFIINALGEGAINELRPIGDESPATARKRWLANHGETLENAYRDYLRREGAEESEIENAMESPSFSASALVRDVVLRARNYMRTGPETRRTEYDAEATRTAIMEAVDQASYREWLNETFSGLVKRTGIYNGKEIFNRRGNRRSWGELHNAYTLENIVNAMRNVQEERGQGAWGVGATTLQAVAAPSYKSIQEMKGDSGKLGAVDGDEYTAAVEAVDAQVDGIIQKIKSTNKSHSDNSFVESDNIATALKETAKGRKTIDAIMRSFAEYGYKISNQTAKDIQMLYKAASDLPTEYFEAKPQRAVGFDEVLAAIIPDDSSEKLRTGLEQAGVRTLEYKSGDDTDRLAKINSVEGARFSLKTDSQGRTLTEQQREYFKDSKAVDGQGRLLVLYHGTGAKFTVFDKTRIGENFSDRGSDLGFYFSPYVEDANGYAREAAGYQGNGEVMQVYLNLKNPLVIEDEGWGSAIGQADIRHGDLKRWAQDGGHDGIIVKSTDIEMDDDGTPDAVYIAFSPNQIKSTDNKVPTIDPDIRYSLKGSENTWDTAKLREQNNLLREKLDELKDVQRKLGAAEKRADYWKNQTKRTTEPTLRQSDTDKFARKLTREYDSSADVKTVSRDIKALGEAMLRDGEITWSDAKGQAVSIAREILNSSATVVDVVDADTLRDIKTTLRRGMSISQQAAQDIPDFAAWQQRQRGRITVGKDNGKAAVDTVYGELNDAYPGLFPADIMSESDMLLQMADVLDTIAPVAVNQYTPYMDEAVEYLSNDILGELIDDGIRLAPPTFADRQAAKLDAQKEKDAQKLKQLRDEKNAKIKELREEGARRTKEALRKARADRDAQINDLKKKHAQKLSEQRLSRNAAELRERIGRHVKDLSTLLMSPTDKKHVPQNLRGPLAEFLSAVDMSSKFDTVRIADGKTARVDRGLGEATKRTLAAQEMIAVYKQLASDGAMLFDPALFEGDDAYLRQLAQWRTVPVSQMSLDQLNLLWKTVRSIETTIRNANRLFSEERWKTVDAITAEMRSESARYAEDANNSALVDATYKFIALDMATPETYFHRLGETGDQLFRSLRDAQDKQTFIVRDTAKKTQEAVKDVNVRELERTFRTVKLGGKNVNLSVAELMELRNLIARDQAQDHLMRGGIQPESIQVDKKTVRNTAVIRGVTYEELIKAVSTLTPKELAVADALRNIMQDLAKEGNKASLAVYGYEKFTESDYWTIRSSATDLPSRTENAKDDTARVANYGMAKPTRPNANTAVRIGSIFDTFDRHVAQMSAYASYLEVETDLSRILNYKWRGEDGQITGTVKEILDSFSGKGGYQYLEKLMSDIAKKGSNSSSLFSRAVAGFKRSAVGANLRVVAQQPTSLPKAFAVIDPKYFIHKPKSAMNGWEKAKKYSGIAQWKDWGFFDINTGRSIKNIMFDSSSRLETVQDKLMWGAAAADALTWGAIWNACENEVKHTNKTLEPESAEFYDAVKNRFNEVIDRTQVVDGVLQRSQFMRGGEVNNMLASFMGEPTKTVNMLIRAFDDVGRKRPGAKAAAGKALVSIATSLALNSFIQSLIDGLRDDDREKKYWEKVMSAFWGITGDEESVGEILKNFATGNFADNFNPLQYFPYARDVWSAVRGYTIDRPDTELLSKAVNVVSKFYKAVVGRGGTATPAATLELSTVLMDIFGVPASNLLRDIKSILRTAVQKTGNSLLEYRFEKFFYNVGATGNLSLFAGILDDARQNDPEAYEIIYADMVKNGVSPKKIRNRMNVIEKEREGVKNVSELENPFVAPNASIILETADSFSTDFNALELMNDPLWQLANDMQRMEAAELAYDYAANDLSDSMEAKFYSAEENGISPEQYAIFRLALEMADEPTESGVYGTFNQAEAVNAIEMMHGLARDQKAYLWQSMNKTWKDNPYD